MKVAGTSRRMKREILESINNAMRTIAEIHG